MIPADVASRLQISADTALRPVAPAQEIADRLSGLVAGQKVMAQIQALLPNGTYRAMINQRSITLALPFSAKSGDALELQVTESDGKLALAVVVPKDDGGKTGAATSTTLSRTGQMISTLFSEARDARGGAAASAVPLNAYQPIGAAPVSAQDLLPQLKQAITQSGMFYEAHQAEWVEGRLSKAALLQEPQGRLSAPATLAGAETDSAAPPSKTAAGELATAPRLAADNVAASEGGKTGTAQSGVQNATPGAAQSATQNAAQTPGRLVAPQAQALVQQQLEALATQNFSWQGQIWPGQEMRWEIDENAARNSQGGDSEEGAARWATRLHLTLPNLGEVDAQIRLQGNQITLAMSAGNAETRALMRASGVTLRSQLDQAGISLASMGVAALPAETSDGQAGQ
jgi:hypothetical protein